MGGVREGVCVCVRARVDVCVLGGNAEHTELLESQNPQLPASALNVLQSWINPGGQMEAGGPMGPSESCQRGA